ncbi:hypothetical protein QEH53_02970 [Pelagicoccus sp. SDUM812002]|nr:hypothetical protein [Pelagicoccus sp. SDUM812002]
MSATFDGLNQLNPANLPKVSREAPKAIANDPGIGSETQRLGLNSAATSGTNQVGTIIDTLA